MSYLQQQMQYLKFDKRLLEINLKNGSITEEEYKQHLSTLNDDVENSEKLNLDGDSTDAGLDTMNGESHPVEAPVETAEQPVMPTNTDPFGSGY